MTIKKILSVIEENNFQPNSNARHLKMQSSSSVILIVKGTSNLLFADIVEQMQSLFLKNGENVSTYYIDDTIFNPPESFTPGNLSETIMVASASYAFP